MNSPNITPVLLIIIVKNIIHHLSHISWYLRYVNIKANED